MNNAFCLDSARYASLVGTMDSTSRANLSLLFLGAPLPILLPFDKKLLAFYDIQSQKMKNTPLNRLLLPSFCQLYNAYTFLCQADQKVP